MDATRLKRTKTSEGVVEYLVLQILDGQLRAGERIDFTAVSEALDVSRSPVHEALVMLERDGLVRMPHHRGAFVEAIDAESVLDDFEILGRLSGIAVARVAAKNDPVVIPQLQAMMEQLRQIDSVDDQRAGELIINLVRAQHLAGGSSRLRAILRASTSTHWLFHLHFYRPLETMVQAHQLVMDAIVAGEAEHAATYRFEDFRDAGKGAVEELVRRGVIAL